MGRALLFVLAIACGACTVSPPDFGAKACPCADGHYCDIEQNRCLPGSLGIEVSSLKPIWSTPHQVRWSWKVRGKSADLARYEIVTGPSASDVRERTAAATIWTPDQNPELGVFQKPHTQDGDLVTATTTHDHPELTEVFAELRAIDTQQRISVSNIASVRTTIGPKVDLPIFIDQMESWQNLTPVGAQLAASGGVEDSPCIEFEMQCAGDICFEQVGINSEPDWAAMSPGDFETTAYLEIAIQTDSTTPSFWSQLRIAVQRAPEKYDYFFFYGFGIKAEGFRVFEVPLRAFSTDVVVGDELLGYEAVADRLQQVTLGGNLSDGAIVRVDNIRLRW